MRVALFQCRGGDPEGVIKNRQKKHINLIPIILNHLISNEQTFTVNGGDYPTADGTCVRDYIHIEDLGAAHILGMEKLFAGNSSNIYNLGNGKGYSILEVIRAAETVSGKKINYSIGPRRAGDPPILMADASKAQTELLWTPEYPDLNTIIEDAWKALNF